MIDPLFDCATGLTRHCNPYTDQHRSSWLADAGRPPIRGINQTKRYHAKLMSPGFSRAPVKGKLLAEWGLTRWLAVRALATLIRSDGGNRKMHKIFMAGAMLGLVLGVAVPIKATALTLSPATLTTATDSDSMVVQVQRRRAACRCRLARSGLAARLGRTALAGRLGRPGLLLQPGLLQPLLQSAMGLLPDHLVERRTGVPLASPSLVVSLTARRGDCVSHSERSPPSI
jgi:hypothetical protein